MITVKAFEKDIKCRDFQYEVGKTYTMPTEEVRICERGFHASANCDISETIEYYPNVANSEYALVDINVVDSMSDKVVGDRITIIRKLETLDGLIQYDKTVRWCYWFAKDSKGADVKKLYEGKERHTYFLI